MADVRLFCLITFVHKCMCVRPRGHKLPVALFRLYIIGRMIAATFQFRLVALAVDVIDRRDPSNEMRRQLQPQKINGRLY